MRAIPASNAVALTLIALPAVAQDYSLPGDGSTHYTFADDTDFDAKVLYQCAAARLLPPYARWREPQQDRGAATVA